MQPRIKRDIVDRCNRFHSPIEIAGHPVSGAEEKLLVSAIREIEQSRMLQKPSDDADHPDPITHTLNTRTQTADATHDEIDFHARL